MEIDIDLITVHDMTADEYILLQFIRNRYYGKIRSYFSNREHLKICLEKLAKTGFIELLEYGIPSAPQDYKIVRLPMYSTKVLDSMFEEFVENYPKQVIRPNGIKEYLRSNTDRARELYRKATNDSKEKHELILDSLKYQLAHYARLGKMPYMPKMINWLVNEEWEEFKDYVLDEASAESNIESEIYG